MELVPGPDEGGLLCEAYPTRSAAEARARTLLRPFVLHDGRLPGLNTRGERVWALIEEGSGAIQVRALHRTERAARADLARRRKHARKLSVADVVVAA